MSRIATLGRAERLKSRKAIDQLFANGRKLNHPPFRLFYRVDAGGLKGIRFGAGVSSRSFRRAVDRNRIKRLIREACRLQKQLLDRKLAEKGGEWQLFFIYTGKELPDFTTAYTAIGILLQKLDKG